MKRLSLLGAAAAALAIAAVAVLYVFFGMRIVPDGTLIPEIRFVKSPEAQARAIEQHRAAQRAEAPGTMPEAGAGGPAPAERPSPDPGAGAAPADPSAGSALRAADAVAAAWTGFRGPARDGHYRGAAIRVSWPPALAPMWKQPIGGGYASFAVAGGRAFTIEQRGRNEVAAAYDVMTGRELWTNAWPAFFQESMGGDGPRATPTWADGLVYALGAEGELRALEEATGRVVWRTNILDDARATNLTWGMAASPLVVGDAVIVLPGGGANRSVAAYERKTGRLLWTALDDRQSYAAPMFVTFGGVPQFLVVSAQRLVGLSVDRREVLWEFPWVTGYEINAAQPIVIGDNRVFYSSGYGVGAAVLELTRAGARFDVREVWRNNRMKNRVSSSVLHDGFIYGLDEAILACLDAATGDLKWKGGRYGYGQVVLASGHLVVTTETGDLVLVAAMPDAHREIARVPAVSGRTWNVPSFADGILLVRNTEEMAAFDLRPGR